MKKYSKEIIIIIAIILGCSIASRLLTSGETLADYANKYPDKAYTTSESSVDNP
ncbi:hypothetical protein [Butyrivibrio sp. MC2013]|uniref:hypothetical protein n=1 Tax=Butyrivibrio sp. MC2013 TaxID=1280686 RepID=UPI0018CB07F6|nr:hypothetical protein [Butyrivibrio sp. MC2013]